MSRKTQLDFFSENEDCGLVMCENVEFWGRFLEKRMNRRETYHRVYTLTPEMVRKHASFMSAMDDKLVEAFKKAIISTADVFKRRVLATSAFIDPKLYGLPTIDQLKSKKSRVGFFANALRRELSPLAREMREIGGDDAWLVVCNFVSKLAQTEMWSDIAIPSDTWGWTVSYACGGVQWQCTFAHIEELIKMAQTTIQFNHDVTPKTYRNPLLETTDQASSDLANLEKEMYRFTSGINEAKRINKEADDVVSGLCALASALPTKEENTDVQ